MKEDNTYLKLESGKTVIFGVKITPVFKKVFKFDVTKIFKKKCPKIPQL